MSSETFQARTVLQLNYFKLSTVWQKYTKYEDKFIGQTLFMQQNSFTSLGLNHIMTSFFPVLMKSATLTQAAKTHDGTDFFGS